jgi:hypothetical protein
MKGNRKTSVDFRKHLSVSNIQKKDNIEPEVQDKTIGDQLDEQEKLIEEEQALLAEKAKIIDEKYRKMKMMRKELLMRIKMSQKSKNLL